MTIIKAHLKDLISSKLNLPKRPTSQMVETLPEKIKGLFRLVKISSSADSLGDFAKPVERI